MLPLPLRALFVNAVGEEPDAIEKLKGDASRRELYRLGSGSATLIGVWNPHGAPENAAFLGFSRGLRRHGLPVPSIRAMGHGGAAYLEQDLGDVTLLSWIDDHGDDRWTRETIGMYQQVLEYLTLFQTVPGGVDYSLCYQGQEFDEGAMMRDLRYFEREFLEPFLPQHLDLTEDFAQLTSALGRCSRDGFMYRDFQARNVMLVGEAPWFLDYQSGRRGPLPYDVASLLFDGAVSIPAEVRGILLAAYLEKLKRRRPFDRQAFLTTFPGFALLRILQALGAYGFLSRQRARRHYLARVPTALRNLEWLGRRWPADLPKLPGVWRTVGEFQQQAHLHHLA